jgi:hypothetical protein
VTVPEPLARLAEGWCPHPDHGRLQPGGRCPACDGAWRSWQHWPEALAFRVTAGPHCLTRVMLPCDVTGKPPWPALAIGQHVNRTHQEAAAGPPGQEPAP